MGISLIVKQAGTAQALVTTFDAMRRERAQALIVQSPFTNEHRKRIVELAAQHHMHAIFESESFVVNDGGLMSYGPDSIELFEIAAQQVDKIFKGAKPADLPTMSHNTVYLSFC